MLRKLAAPIVLCLLGLWLTFHSFWSGFDAISGDAQDARFIAYILEHTWRWVTGANPQLFHTPFYFPHANVYAMSEYFFGCAPVYWLFRAGGLEILQSYQAWLVGCTVLNFTAFYFLATRVLRTCPEGSAFGAYVFTFALPRLMQLGHSQLMLQFFMVLSAYGAFKAWQNPRARAPYLFFFFGAALQLITSFYLLWFWMWTLVVFLVYIAASRERRRAFREWAAQVPRSWALSAALLSLAAIWPFLYRYGLIARESGPRSWVAIVESVPKAYSWFALPASHWEWGLTPFKSWILDLRGLGEHYLSFGFVTWTAMIAALIATWKQRDWRWLAVPVVAMFALTLTSGRFSTWVFPAYLIPGGRALRSVSRIQVFMLFFWGLLIARLLQNYWQAARSEGRRWKRALVAIWVLAFFGENTLVNGSGTFSAKAENARIAKLAEQIPADCEVIYSVKDFAQPGMPSLDTMIVAQLLNRKTINGYTGQVPPGFRETLAGATDVPPNKRVERWISMHGVDPFNFRYCSLP